MKGNSKEGGRDINREKKEDHSQTCGVNDISGCTAVRQRVNTIQKSVLQMVGK